MTCDTGVASYLMTSGPMVWVAFPRPDVSPRAYTEGPVWVRAVQESGHMKGRGGGTAKAGEVAQGGQGRGHREGRGGATGRGTLGVS